MELTTPSEPDINPGWRPWWGRPRWARPRWPWPWPQGLAPRSSTPTPSRSTGSWTSAPPSPASRSGRRSPHHLIDVADPPETYDAARFCREGRAVLDDLRRRGVPPLVVGGTGLYLKALLSGLFAEGEPAPGVRERVRQELEDLGAARPCISASPTWTRPPPPGSTPTTPTGLSGPWR